MPDPVVALWKDDIVERIDLDALNPVQIEDVLAEAVGGPVETR